MNADDKDKEIIFLRDKINQQQLQIAVSIRVPLVISRRAAQPQQIALTLNGGQLFVRLSNC